jgi:small ligand-binding sensory domain FIST
MTQFRQLVTSFSPKMQGLNCKVIQVEVVVDKVALEQIFL